VIIPLVSNDSSAALERVNSELINWHQGLNAELFLWTIALFVVALLRLLQKRRLEDALDLSLLYLLAITAPPLVAFGVYYYYINLMTKIHFVIFALFIAVSSQAQVSKLVTGTIRDQRTLDVADEVELELRSADNKKTFTTETDDNGVFKFKNIPLGKYTLHVSDKDYVDIKQTVELKEEHQALYKFGKAITTSLKVSWLFNWGDRETTLKNGKVVVQEHFWSHFVAKIVLTIYGLCLLLVFFYSVLQLSLAIAYVKNKKKKIVEERPNYDPATTPKVTIQLPMFNEMYVSDRIIETIAKLEYPADKLQIQVLDDSTDETKDLIAKKVAEVAARGVNIQHIHRVDRTGYKAGALDAAMDRVEGEFIAIFDADFIPDADWLQKTMPSFQDDSVGVVQTRWGHINKNYSILRS
jgi:hypothetical protein